MSQKVNQRFNGTLRTWRLRSVAVWRAAGPLNLDVGLAIVIPSAISNIALSIFSQVNE